MNGDYNIIVDPENNKVSKVEGFYSIFRRVYAVTEDMHFVYNSGDYEFETDVKKGDLIGILYHREYKDEVVIFKCEKLFDNIIDRIDREQKEKEKWASEQQNLSCANCDNAEYKSC